MTANVSPVRMGLGRRGAWAALLAGVGALGVVEFSVLHLLANGLLPSTVALIIDLVVGIPTAALILAVASPLWSAHRLDRTHLRLRFGWLATIDIPLTLIDTAAVYRPPVQHPAQTGLDFDEKSARWTAIRSPSAALVRIDLTEPIPARTQGWRRVSARSVVISVDNAADFLSAVDSARGD
ncbi:hypothetical protein AB0M22_28980 [Nocardia sp. NPDC051756]|uniref:hypothetical protein n=1 Tax=Nocardia sp. NPDC051756 TaxID=3154751 RepID=UPI0034431FE1